jgi:hypothetical protein
VLFISSRSTIYVRVNVTDELPDGAVIDPTGDVVQFAFQGPWNNVAQAQENPPTSSTTWHTGSWDTDIGSPFTARILVGPSGSVALVAGTYVVWILITDNPEIPCLLCGPLVVV